MPHYAEYWQKMQEQKFAINPYKDTLTPKRDPDHNGDLMGQRERLSDEDVNILKKIYCSQSGSAGGSEENTKNMNVEEHYNVPNVEKGKKSVLLSKLCIESLYNKSFHSKNC
uniref:Peptidase M12A domain-containing protein n=1 Tax=Romanomermis culicivorax TaxID=13658 RepID=A0A915JT52_ROMCU